MSFNTVQSFVIDNCNGPTIENGLNNVCLHPLSRTFTFMVRKLRQALFSCYQNYTSKIMRLVSKMHDLWHGIVLCSKKFQLFCLLSLIGINVRNIDTIAKFFKFFAYNKIHKLAYQWTTLKLLGQVKTNLVFWTLLCSGFLRSLFELDLMCVSLCLNFHKYNCFFSQCQDVN